MLGKCLKWVFQVSLRGFPVGRDSLEVKKEYQGQILVNYSCHGLTFLLVSKCVLGKTPKRCLSRYLELDCGPKVILQWFCLYSSKRWQSVSSYNLHKELNGIKGLLVKKQFFLHWIRLRYQSQLV